MLSPGLHAYELYPADYTLVSFVVALPTTTSNLPLRTRLPVTCSTTISNCITLLGKELGLPSSTLDLVGPGSKSRVSRTVAATEEDQGERIRWDVSTGARHTARLDLSERLLNVVKDGQSDPIFVAIDESWLLESIRHDAPAEKSSDTQRDSGDIVDPSSTATVSTADEDEDKDDTLKANKVEPPLPSHCDGRTSAPTPARLSSLFAAAVDTKRHPSPPSTPQATLSGHQVDVADAIAQALSDNVDSGLPSSQNDWVFGSSAPLPLLQGPNHSQRRSEDIPRTNHLRHRSGKSVPTTGISVDTAISAASPAPLDPPSPTPHNFISLSTGTGSTITRLLSQDTGGSTASTPVQEGWTKRFSLPNFGGWIGSPASTMPRSMERPEDASDSGSIRSSTQESVHSNLRPLESHTTGGLWGWWTGSRPAEGSAEAYVMGLNER